MIRSMPVMFRVLGFSDWPLRVFIALVRHVILPLMGLLNIRKLAQDEARGMISELFEGMIPASAWRAGTLNDHLRLGKTPLALEACRVPTLIVHGTADPAAAYEQARAAADAVSGAVAGKAPVPWLPWRVARAPWVPAAQKLPSEPHHIQPT